MILHSAIFLSHNRPNQFSEQIHANLRAELGTVIGDSIHSPYLPHGLIGAHNEDTWPIVVELDPVVVVGQDGVTVGQEGVVVGQVDVVVGQEGVGEGQVVVGQGDEVVVSVGLTMYRDRRAFF